jgi:predicted ArsR family transcriptional regulator
LDSTPSIRRHAFETLTETPTPTRDIARVLKPPTTTTRRALEELVAHGLAVREVGEEKKGGPDLWALHPEWRGWAEKCAAGGRGD